MNGCGAMKSSGRPSALSSTSRSNGLVGQLPKQRQVEMLGADAMEHETAQETSDWRIPMPEESNKAQEAKAHFHVSP